MNLLSEIISRKRQLVQTAKQLVPLEHLREVSRHVRSGAPAHALRKALSPSDSIKVIAEFKRRSPSKGVIRAEADPVEIAREYVEAGAAGISVLTEENYFDGSLDDLRSITNAVELPVLRKDFIFDRYQIHEAAGAGADAVLLIVAALEDRNLTVLREVVEDELGMDALVEVHDESELQRAVACGATTIGVNNRNLRTFDVSIDTSFRLVGQAPPESLLVSESGLNSAEDLQRLRRAGYKGFLIGESLMSAPSPGTALRALLSWWQG
ncbi:MAG TPA: indole-3-glycerol phosphate synthase TrpC [Pyrinomonadaceae bacterium]